MTSAGRRVWRRIHSLQPSLALLGPLVCGVPPVRQAAAQIPNAQQVTPEERIATLAKLRAAAVADRQSMMDLLGLKAPDSLPPPASDPHRPQQLTQRAGSNNWYDANGNTHVRSEWGSWTNYDESSVAPYTLPDPLVLKNGRRVTSAATWRNERRPQIVSAFLSEIYGRIPNNTPSVTFEVTGVDSSTYAGRAIIKKVVGRIDNARYPAAEPSIEITMYLPAVAAPAPGSGYCHGRRSLFRSEYQPAARCRRAGLVARLGLRHGKHRSRPGRQRGRTERRNHRIARRGETAKA